MKKLGLDLGSSSIGWALRDGNEISKKGVVTFHSGMVKGQSGGYSSPTKDRREARSKRKLIQARKYRKWELLEILLDEFAPLNRNQLENWSKYKKGQSRKFPENENFLKWLACDFTYESGIKYDNPYEVRVKALDNKLSKHEFGRALYHIVQRRGYKDIGESDKETEKQKTRRGETGFQKALNENRTVAEALKREFLDNGERARNQYPYREEYENELLIICKVQNCDEVFIQKLWKAIIWQRPLRSQKGNIGKCTLEPNKPRSPVSHPVFEIFRAWSFINTIKYFDEKNKKQNIPAKYRNQLFEFFLKKEKNFKFEEIRDFLDKQFKNKKQYNYPIDKKTGKYDTSVSGMPVCKGLKSIIGDNVTEAISTIHTYNIGNAPKIHLGYSIYDLWHILFEFDESHLKDFAIEKLKIENKKNKKGEEFNPFVKLKGDILTSYSDLSLKAMCKIIPFLKEGFLYNEAVVLAKIPELLGEKWESAKNKIFENVKLSNNLYNWNKTIIGITNNLIDQYKGLDNQDKFAVKDFQYILDDSDLIDINNACQGYFGEKSWENSTDNNEIVADVKKEYQEFFQDSKRAYRRTPLLTEIFKDKLRDNKIEIAGNLYHHSNRENRYLKECINTRTGEIKLPTYQNSTIEILPEPRIDSIKNPMFNKSMSILRKVVNQLIIDNAIDEDTEIVIEVARELNDNNKRAAIERYQNDRKNKREKYREFLNEFKEKENKSLNVEESILPFELWTEQTFEEAENESKEKVNNKTHSEILKEKDALKRYELWMEQKGQCIYTGRMISITQLLFSNDIDIEHTIPRSLLPDNTLANQTVCYAWYNRDKKHNQIPKQCENYSEDKEGWGTRIEPRLDNWIEKRDKFKNLYEERIKPNGNEDESKKNSRIQEKHFFKMHYDYWKDKVERFTADEVKDSWARRQLVDTQMVSKYSVEFLKTYFKKVAVQKGSVTADFRKIYSFQEQEEIKSRNRHTHHAIDAAVLTLIPVNSSRRDSILKKMYEMDENENRQYTTMPFKGFNSQQLIRDIDSNTLVVNYENDKLLKRTYKNVRKRGRLQYLKDKRGKLVLDQNGNKIILKAKGDTVRSTLFAQTYLAKIKDVERYNDGQPMRENGDWKYKAGKDEFIFVKKEDIEKVKKSDKLIEAIIDSEVRNLVDKQKNNTIVKDYQGNTIRHVRIKTSSGQKVKERINYRSQHEHKNHFYSGSGSLPYALLFQKNKNERAMIPIASFEVAKTYKKSGSFDIEEFVKEFHPEFSNYLDKKLLRVGQKVIVLTNDKEYEKRKDIDFQTKRLYVITQFSEGSIWLQYHLEARRIDDIKIDIKSEKDKLLREYERQFEIAEVIEDATIENKKQRKEDYDNKRFRFDTLNTYRFKKLREKVPIEKVKEIKKKLDKFKAIPSTIEMEGKTTLLKMSKENWNFLYEGEDYQISFLGEITWS